MGTSGPTPHRSWGWGLMFRVAGVSGSALCFPCGDLVLKLAVRRHLGSCGFPAREIGLFPSAELGLGWRFGIGRTCATLICLKLCRRTLKFELVPSLTGYTVTDTELHSELAFKGFQRHLAAPRRQWLHQREENSTC